MKIAFFEIKGWEKKYLNKALKGHQISYFAEKLDSNNVSKVKNTDILSTFIYSKVDKPILAKLPKLQQVCTRSTGFDHIDLRACRQKKVMVCNVPNYGENTVAEHTFALILSLSRNIHKSYIRTLKDDFSIEGLKGFDLKGKTLGIVGAGSIGLHVIRMAKSFGMEVLAFDVKPDPFLAEVLDFKYAPLNEVLKNSDIISLHAPHNEHTHHMINRKTVKIIKPGAVLINTARGGLVDNDALAWALDNKILAGAALDVIEGEEIIKEEKQLLYDKNKSDAAAIAMKGHELFFRDNVIFTPHIAFYSQEALQRILEITVANINGLINKDQINVVS